MSSAPIIFRRSTIWKMPHGGSKRVRPEREQPTRKPTFPRTHLRNRGRCCSEERVYLFQVEWLESSAPGWRNWQTQRTQNPPGFGPWGFNSPSRHHISVAMLHTAREQSSLKTISAPVACPWLGSRPNSKKERQQNGSSATPHK